MRITFSLLVLLAACGENTRPTDKTAPEPEMELPEGEPVDLVPYINPMISAGGAGAEVGSGYPGASRPFSLVKLSPDTGNASGGSFRGYHGGGYHWDDEYLHSFSHMHLHGPGLTDYGYPGVMPSDGMAPEKTNHAGYLAPFSHDDEEYSAGWYAIDLPDPGVRAELTLTDHTGLHRYTFDEGTEPVLILDLGHMMTEAVNRAGSVTLDPETGTFEGSMTVDGGMAGVFTTYFAGRLDPVPVAHGTWVEDGVLQEGSTSASAGDPSINEHSSVGMWFQFEGPEVHLQLALSLVDIEGARQNLEDELVPDFDLEATRAEAEAAWREWLSPIEVVGGSEDDRVIFATALYHCLLMPTRYSDVDGRYLAFNGVVRQSDRGYHSDMSLWDTYRTTHPLYTLLWPDAHEDILWSLGEMADTGGNIPKWPMAADDGGFMVGSPGHIVFGEAVAKGLSGFGEEALLDNALALSQGTLDAAYGGRPDVSLVDTYGYYPHDIIGRSVAWTQENAIADHALSLAAERLGRDEETIHFLQGRAESWRPLYDPEVGYFHGRLSDGSFAEFRGDSYWLDEYAEGNARQYLWLVPHDPEGLFEVLGGPDVAVARLEEMFEESERAASDNVNGVPEPWYWHGNEVDLHAPWLFALAGRPDLTRQWVDWVWDRWYGTGADGLAGNDDGGTLSAWAVWAGIGMFPLAGTDRYVLGEPRFDIVRIAVEGGSFTIMKVGEGPTTEVRLDGEVIGVELRHEQIKAGSELWFCAEDACW